MSLQNGQTGSGSGYAGSDGGVPGSSYVLETENQPVHMLQLARRLADYRNMNRQIGTVILSVDQSVLWEDIQVSDKSTVYVCEADQIIAAADSAEIGTSISLKPQRGYRVLETRNDKTGWDVPFLF